MKYLKFILIILAIGSFIYYYFWGYNNKKQQIENDRQLEQLAGEVQQKQWETKIDDQPPVTIKITPIELGRDTEIWKFQVVFDTHSGSLDDDMLTAVSLADDKGNTYQPTIWNGPAPGGHHREGVLIFNAINPTPEYVELKIKNVGGIPERSFKWSIK
ncbi:MAG: hypothetical protein HY452_01975 [Parcubacteria group bacterium]|nr:hypothetical protein [Parcubacteria group bacterium]